MLMFLANLIKLILIMLINYLLIMMNQLINLFNLYLINQLKLETFKHAIDVLLLFNSIYRV